LTHGNTSIHGRVQLHPQAMTAFDVVLSDLAAEYDGLLTILSALTTEQWHHPSLAPGWSVRDVVVHLASSEAGVATTLAHATTEWHVRDRPLDHAMDDAVRADSSTPADVLHRWVDAAQASLRALRSADPTKTYRWAAAPLKPQTLATTRLAEHWAHGLDVTVPLGIEFPDTDRLRHIAWLGHATIPYALRLAGIEPFPVRAELSAPSGARWSFGPESAAARITGPAAAWCRVGARRVTASDSGLSCEGPGAATALEHLRNYAA
jgi:uncharacterized protein (TIGR03084 family)